MIFVVGFGWAKPVPINPLYFKNRKLGTIIVSIAGPLTNFLIATISAILLSLNISSNTIIISILQLTIIYNIVLGVFNLIPLPPLDGSKIIASLLPDKYEALFYKHEKYLYGILLLLLITGTMKNILNPLLYFGISLVNKIILTISNII
ncbi:site-2 protease family protein [Caldisalinibacter kiritimatiensis]|uniref:Peptidase M50 n=1 Tax=Caldisalinibacter kiritimatiensis TaxID=1304284 RepID=R1CWT0_9FIRM|nr:site-2 protease family protein [Caldisalinibacter kiritimatiensis]EOD01079.1 Peptidase M50 [Caldisalinibacter kiritimatiensis]